MWKAGFTEKTITWMALDRHSISDSSTMYFLFLGYLKLSRYIFFDVSEALILSKSLYHRYLTYLKQEDLCITHRQALPSNMNILHQASTRLFLSPALITLLISKNPYHSWRHVRWMNFIEPSHLQGLINGFSGVSVSSKHILQFLLSDIPCSLALARVSLRFLLLLPLKNISQSNDLTL